ncbi:MAG: serine hydrolase domain-containing protein [Gaiellaceae bacterium]
MFLLITGLLLIATLAAVLVDRTVTSGARAECRAVTPKSSETTRPKLQRILDGLVTGKAKLAPGASAYVSGPHGSWLGAGGVADTATCDPMGTDARMRLESVSKIYTATLILQLAQEGKLRVGDTVAKWLPGLLPYGNLITIQQLLTMRSGLIDNNDLKQPAATPHYLANVKDPRLRAELETTLKRRQEDPAGVASPMFWIRFAAWQPLLYRPGAYHYSNIGYDVLGLIAEKASGMSLQALYEKRIFRPLGLHATAYDPQGPISGPHAHGYGIDPGGQQTDTTDWHSGIGADGGIVSNAKDTAAFLTALMQGKLLDHQQLEAMKGANLWNGGAGTGCSDAAYGWSGGGDGYKTEVWVNGNGSRVAVLLLNARHWDTDQSSSDAAAHDTLMHLYCAA